MMPFHVMTVFFTIVFATENPVLASENTSEFMFIRSRRGYVPCAPSMETVVTRSVLECAVKCSKLAVCDAINVCYDDLQQVICSILADTGSVGCENLHRTDSHCFHVKKSIAMNEPGEITQTPSVCQNGGILLSDRCTCPLSYTGLRCERRIRDCSEIYEKGLNTELSNVYDIQPITSPTAFKAIGLGFEFINNGPIRKRKSSHSCVTSVQSIVVRECICNNAKFPCTCQVYCAVHAWGASTYPLRRPAKSNFAVNWTTAQQGFYHDLQMSNEPKSYFIGLDNLHHLLNQAQYAAEISMTFGDGNTASIMYPHFSIGNESTSYALTYSSFYSGGHLAEDGFSASQPVIFSTHDRDVNNCTQLKLHPGWFGRDCSGFSVFADDLQWPFDLQTVNLSFLEIALSRHDPFFEN